MHMYSVIHHTRYEIPV